MKPTTGHKPNSPISGTIPTSHDVIAPEKTVEFESWLDDQLADLEASFAEFVTKQALMSEIASQRR